MKRKVSETNGTWPRCKEDVVCFDLSPNTKDIEAALAGCENLPLKDLTCESFVVGKVLKLRLEEALHEVQHGSGAVLLRLPSSWIVQQGEDACQRAFFGLCSHLGKAVTQSTDLGELCARVEDAVRPEVLAAQHTKRRGYRNARDQFLHVDSSIPASRGAGACDVLAMLCIRPAKQGGVSKMASAEAIFEQLREHHPDLLATLQKGFKYNAAAVEYHPDWRQPATGDEERPMVYTDANGRPCVQYAKNMVETITAMYAGSVQRKEEVKVALSKLEEVCSNHAVVQYWDLQAGEAYLVDNYRWMHARTQFEDDPSAPRLLFRVWLQVENFDSSSPSSRLRSTQPDDTSCGA
eukprot:TRINITY_DN63827_c0_g1_i1.p1 TRINITY_DN63827_c0_g1~~TRINITY_DN63827_c0_g1_i1.p1  ORF type:complete len:350 (-),score=70.15 TRINITY_DN63827_c0_g1_i1:74-1123(-)